MYVARRFGDATVSILCQYVFFARGSINSRCQHKAALQMKLGCDQAQLFARLEDHRKISGSDEMFSGSLMTTIANRKWSALRWGLFGLLKVLMPRPVSRDGDVMIVGAKHVRQYFRSSPASSYKPALMHNPQRT